MLKEPQPFRHTNDRVDAQTPHRVLDADYVEVPLSYGQRALWFLQQLNPESAAYNIARAVHVHGVLDVRILEHAFQALMDRHPLLRATFDAPSGEPVAHIHAHTPVCFDEEDASAWNDERLYARLSEELYRPFDLARGPLMRVRCLTLDPADHVVMMAVHHTMADLWSVAILLHELDQFYLAERDGVAPNLKPPRMNYADYVRAQNEMLSGAEGERLWSYWKNVLSGDLPPLSLVTDRPRPAHQSGRGSSRFRRLGPELTEQLRRLADAQQVPLHILLLAAYQVLLHRYTGQDDILVGYPKASRSPRLARVVGYFVNSIVMRANLAGNPTFAAFLAQVRETVEGAFAHDELPFALLVERLQPLRDASRAPIFQIMFAWQKTTRLLNRQELTPFALGEADGEMALLGLRLGSMVLEQQISPFDLTLLMAETDTDLVAALEYASDLFDAVTIHRMLAHYQALLESIVADPQQRVGDLTLLSEEERAQALSAREAPAQAGLAADPPVSPIPLFEAQAERAPEATALILARPLPGQVALTYGELNRQAARVARRLRGLGVGPGVVVGVAVERSLGAVAALLGILKAGGTYLPLDPEYPPERLAFMLHDAGAKLLLTQQGWDKALPTHPAQVVAWEGLVAAEDAASAKNIVETMPSGGDVAYIIYTSGSTGVPKGVLVSYRTLTEHCLRVREHYGLTPADRVLQFPSLVFDPSLEQILPTLLAGAAVVMRGPEMWTPVEFDRQVVAHGVTVANLPTAYWQQLVYAWAESLRPENAFSAMGEAEDGLESADEKAGKAVDPSAVLRLMIPGGDTLRPEVLRLWQQTPMRRVRLLNAYGPTETTITATTYEVPQGRADYARVPIGRPLPGRKAVILDKYGHPTPVGVAGELYLGGYGLAVGYLNQDALTAERFVPDPCAGTGRGRLYKTGDLARYLPDGHIEFLGRVDAQLKVRGYRVELGEVETVLAEHPDVRQAVVRAREDAGGTKYLVAYVVARADGTPAGERSPEGRAPRLMQYLRGKLPEYMVPSSVVLLDALPLTPAGKVDVNALPLPDASHLRGAEGYVAPRNELEEQLAGLWASVLGVERVGMHDSFFDLGGHSLLATQLASRIRQRWGVEVPLRTLFESPTIAAQAPAIAQLRQDSAAGDEDLALLLDELDQLSDNDATQMLSQERGHE